MEVACCYQKGKTDFSRLKLIKTYKTSQNEAGSLFENGFFGFLSDVPLSRRRRDDDKFGGNHGIRSDFGSVRRMAGIRAKRHEARLAPGGRVSILPRNGLETMQAGCLPMRQRMTRGMK
ncbi:protein of unknown function (plasmid) [Shinella sp. WSC3-e]|nr:protein of unknown function [Shinella sp. WSC3-e]